MIIRIATEGQYELGDDHTAELTELDVDAVAACESDDEQHFRQAYDRLLEFVRSHGTPVPEDQLGPSKLILPPPDSSLAEARAECTGDGLIPS